MPPRPSLESIFQAAFGDQWKTLAPKLIEQIKSNISRGMPVKVAVDSAFTRLGVGRKVYNWILDGVVDAILIQVPTADKLLVRNWYLNQTWDAGGLTLSAAVNKLSMKAIVSQTIENQMAEAKSWTSMAQSIRATGAVKGDISATMKELSKATRGTPLEADIASARRQIERLAANDSPTIYLKKSYARLVNAVENGSEESIQKAIEAAIRNKAKYNAQRIARTEMAKAYNEGFAESMIEDEEAVGFRVTLSSRHSIMDICNVMAEADQYGMGNGVFPLSVKPQVPFHPHCMCSLSMVYQGSENKNTFRSFGVKSYLSDLSKGERIALLGVEGSKLDNLKSWKDNLRNWQAPEPMVTASKFTRKAA